MVVYGHWVNESGEHRTGPGLLDVSVIAESPDGVSRVEFAVTVNGVFHSTITANTETWRQPNFSTQTGRMPGTTSGMSRLPCWGVLLNPASYAGGNITIQATVFTNALESYVVPETLRIYNDTDGSDRRPCPLDIYVDWNTGDDSKEGADWSTAVKTPMRAIEVAVGINGGDLGGCRIYYRGTFTDLSNGLFPQYRTSGDWWIQHIADVANGGAHFNPPGDPAPLGPRTIYSGESSGGVSTRHRWIKMRMGKALVAYNFGGTVTNWMDGCWDEAENYLGPGRWTVRYTSDGVNGMGWGTNGPGGAAQAVYTGCRVAGVLIGFEQSRKVLDCVCEDFIGISAKVGNNSPSRVVFANYLMRRQRYRPRLVEGYVRMDNSASGFPCPTLTVTKVNATTARITGPAGGYDFSLDAAALVGYSDYGLRFENDNGTGLATGLGLLVTAVGNTATQPWVEVTCPPASAGTIVAGVGSFYTARVNNGNNYWFVHPDGVQIERDCDDDCFTDCAIYDCDGMQSYFTSGNDLRKCLWRNMRDDGSGDNAFNWVNQGTPPVCLNVYVKSCTIAGQFQCNATDYTGTVVENSVFGSPGFNIDQIPSLGGIVRYCHWITGTAVGTNATSGSWFAGNPATSPYSFEPATLRKGTGYPSIEEVPEIAYTGTPTRGLPRHVAELNWGLSTPPPSGITGTGLGALPGFGAVGSGLTSTTMPTTTSASGAVPFFRGGGRGVVGRSSFDINPASGVQVLLTVDGLIYKVVRVQRLSGGVLNDMFASIAQVAVSVFQDTPITVQRVTEVYDPAEDTNVIQVIASASVLATPPIPFEFKEVNGTSVLETDMRILIPARNLNPNSGAAIYDVQLRL